MTKRMHTKLVTGRRLIASAVTLAAVVAPMAVNTSSASATGLSRMAQTYHLYMSSHPGSFWLYNANQGEAVQMICWTGGPYTDGTGKWFYIERESSPWPEGFVPANAVAVQTQTIVGRCE